MAIPPQVEYMGVVFRNEFHAVHFERSLYVLCASVSVLILVYLIGRYTDKRALVILAAPISGFGFVVHGLATYGALMITKWGTTDGDAMFSVDCIWFNPIMMIPHLVVLIATFYLFDVRRPILEAS